jgi:hypothetical protein
MSKTTSDQGYYLHAPSSVREPINDEPLFWSWNKGGWVCLALAGVRYGSPAKLEVPRDIGTETRWVSGQEASKLYTAWAAKQQARDAAEARRKRGR